MRSKNVSFILICLEAVRGDWQWLRISMIIVPFSYQTKQVISFASTLIHQQCMKKAWVGCTQIGGGSVVGCWMAVRAPGRAEKLRF